MTSRYSRLNYNWASDPSSLVVDPDDDVDHPSGEGGNNKYIKGWVVETEPHEWENYVLKRQEDIEMEKLINGWEVSQDTVSYRFGAIALYNGIPQMYVSVVEFVNPLIHEDDVSNLYAEYLDYLQHEGETVDLFADEDWTPVLAYKLDDYNGFLNSMRNAYSTHLSALNPHADNITAIGGYTQTEINSNLGVVSSDLSTHKGLTNNPHDNDAIEVGTLFTTGGTFTGQVNYRIFIPFGAAPLGGEVTFDSDKFLVARDQESAIGLGTGNYHLGGRWERILCANTYADFAASYNAYIKLPTPDLKVDMKYDMKSDHTLVTFTRNSSVGYTDRTGNANTAGVNVPPFELSGLKLTGATSIKVSMPQLLGATEGTIAYVLNDVLVVKDVHFLSEELTYYFGTTGNVRCFQYWAKRLTPGQKLSVPT